jgi:(p)ppGpp synthase/HD superfamily hydrolase
VLAIVQACTDTPPDYTGGEKPAWRLRKIAYVKHLAETTRSARTVALADKLYNLREINSDLRAEGKRTLKRFNAGAADQLWYFASVLKVLRKTGYSGSLLETYAKSVSEFRSLVR